MKSRILSFFLVVCISIAPAVHAGVLNPKTAGYGSTDENTQRVVLSTDNLASSSDVSAPAANTAAVVTYAAAGAGVRHVIDGIAWSYSGDPTGGNLKIEDGSGNVVFSMDITSRGAGFLPIPRKKGSANTSMIITLAAGGSGVSGKVSVLAHWTE